MKNKKVKNAKEKRFEGIKFKSDLEKTCYELFLKEGFDFCYECRRFELFPSFKLRNITMLEPAKKNGRLSRFMEKRTKAFIKITYTPDFVVNTRKGTVFVEVKGFANDVYPYKRKLFLKMLDDTGKHYWFLEPHNERQILQTINIIKELDNEGT